MTDMNINITITIPQLDTLIALAQGNTPSPAPKGDTAAAAAPGDEAPKATRRTKAQIAADDAAKSAAANEPADEAADRAARAADDGPTTLDYETVVRPKIIQFGKDKGRDAAKALLMEFDVSSGTELDSAVYPAVLKRIDELMQPDAEGDLA